MPSIPMIAASSAAADLPAWALVGTVLSVGAVAALAISGLAWWLWRRPRHEAVGDGDNLAIDIAALPATGPSGLTTQLECYGTPVRLAVFVLAPVGRGGQLPPSQQQLAQIVEQLLPGLLQVVSTHQPLFRRWPEQLSSAGFTQSFFNNLALPGNRGKGTNWCSIAGKFTAGNDQFLVGLVCCGDRPNPLGQITIQHEGQWLDVLRIR